MTQGASSPTKPRIITITKSSLKAAEGQRSTLGQGSGGQIAKIFRKTDVGKHMTSEMRAVAVPPPAVQTPTPTQGVVTTAVQPTTNSPKPIKQQDVNSPKSVALAGMCKLFLEVVNLVMNKTIFGIDNCNVLKNVLGCFYPLSHNFLATKRTILSYLASNQLLYFSTISYT